jgi:hypothetical protein
VTLTWDFRLQVFFKSQFPEYSIILGQFLTVTKISRDIRKLVLCFSDTGDKLSTSVVVTSDKLSPVSLTPVNMLCSRFSSILWYRRFFYQKEQNIWVSNKVYHCIFFCSVFFNLSLKKGTQIHPKGLEFNYLSVLFFVYSVKATLFFDTFLPLKRILNAFV